MKDLLKGILSFWYWIVIFSILLGFFYYFHFMVLSGVNPVLANAFVLFFFLINILILAFIVLKRKALMQRSIPEIIVSLFMIIIFGLTITNMLLTI
jgi:hypothetical protein